MKTNIFIIVFFLLGINFSTAQLLPSSCNAPNNIVASYKTDAERLTIKKIFRVGSTYKDSIEISKAYQDTFMNALIAIYNYPNFFPKSVHVFPMASLRDFAVWADSSLGWMQQLRNNIIPTGYGPVDTLISKYHLHVTSYYSFHPLSLVSFSSDSDYNLIPLTNKFKAIPGVFRFKPKCTDLI